MSVHVSSWAWKEAQSASSGDLLVLLALADMANDDAKAWPSQASLAERSRLTDRQVRRCLRNLEMKKLITESGRTRAGTVIWEITGYLAGADNMSGVEEGRTSTSAAPGHERPVDPDVGVRRIVIESSKEPSSVDSINAVMTVYDYWREARGKKRANYAKASPARVKKIRQRLKEFTAAELCRAIDGVANDPWQDRRLHDDITVIFRNREQVDRFLELGSLTRTGRPIRAAIDRAWAWAESVGWQYEAADVDAEIEQFDLSEEEEAAVRESIDRERARHAA